MNGCGLDCGSAPPLADFALGPILPFLATYALFMTLSCSVCLMGTVPLPRKSNAWTSAYYLADLILIYALKRAVSPLMSFTPPHHPHHPRPALYRILSFNSKFDQSQQPSQSTYHLARNCYDQQPHLQRDIEGQRAVICPSLCDELTAAGPRLRFGSRKACCLPGSVMTQRLTLQPRA